MLYCSPSPNSVPTHIISITQKGGGLQCNPGDGGYSITQACGYSITQGCGNSITQGRGYSITGDGLQYNTGGLHYNTGDRGYSITQGGLQYNTGDGLQYNTGDGGYSIALKQGTDEDDYCDNRSGLLALRAMWSTYTQHTCTWDALSEYPHAHAYTWHPARQLKPTCP